MRHARKALKRVAEKIARQCESLGYQHWSGIPSDQFPLFEFIEIDGEKAVVTIELVERDEQEVHLVVDVTDSGWWTKLFPPCAGACISAEVTDHGGG